MTDNLIGDRYVLGPLLGRGGMAEVRRARDTRLERDVAVKRLKADLAGDPIFQERFRREAHAAAGLNHPNIVSVFDTGESFDEVSGLMIPYIVMELVTGHTLREILHDGRKIQPVKALEIVQSVLDALDYSHRHGIIHRDIKPANVMLTNNGQVKVMDFGIARAVSDTAASMTQTASVIGTPQYLSPEQIRGEAVDRRSDLYSTGCLLYELLTGKPPFEGDSPVSLAYQHVRATPVPPSEIDPLVSAQMDNVVLKALAKNPTDRYQSAHEMHDDIARLLAGQKVQAVIPPPVADTPTEVMGADDRTQVMAPRMAATAVAGPGRAPSRAVTPVEEEEPSHLGRIIGIVVASMLVIALIAAGVIYFINKPESQPAPAVSSGLSQVPSVLTMTEESAIKALSDHHFLTKVERYNGPDDKTVGTVTEQSPEGLKDAPAGSTVTIRINSGPATLALPDVKGKRLEEAQAQLQAAGFTTIKVANSPDEKPSDVSGTVLSTEPAAGASVTKTQTITLYIATGQASLPDVRNMTVADATAQLNAAGFTSISVQSVRIPDDGSVAVGKVVSLTPPHGTATAKDTPIVLNVANLMPNLIGLQETEAIQLTGRMNLKVNPTVPVESAGLAPGTVVHTDPALDSEVSAETTVTIGVAVAPATDSSQTPNPSATTSGPR